MIIFENYNLDDEDIRFILEIEDMCINGQSEITLEYGGDSFVLEPHGKTVQVYAYDKVLGDYESFDDLLLNYKIDGKALIYLIKELDYGE